MDWKKVIQQAYAHAKAQGLTQTQIAEKAGCTQKKISTLVNGKYQPLLGFALRFIEACGLEIEVKTIAMKVIPLHIKILDSKALLEKIAEKLLTNWHDEGQPAKVEIDWFEYGGFYWSANAEIEAEYVVKQYGYDIPPESYCKGMSVEVGAIECTDEEGNPVLVEYFDDERTRIREYAFVEKRIIGMEME